MASLTILASGSLIAQAMTALEQVFLTRIFSAEALGIYAFLISFPHACVGIICGRYDLALVYEEDENKILALVKLNFVINLLLSTILSVGYLVYLVFYTEYQQFAYLVPAVFIYLISYGLTNTLNSYNNRHGEYNMITKMHMLRTFAQCFGTVFLGLIFVILLHIDSLQISVPVLVFPYCVGMLLGIFTQGKGLLSRYKELKVITGKELWEVAKKHKKQPLVSAPAIFANNASYSLITISINNFYDAAVAGYYSISTKLLGMPISLISSNMSKVFMEQAAKEYNATGKFTKAFNKTFGFLVAMAVPMFLCMYFLAPPVCAWLFGGDWVIAGEYIKILAMMFTFRFVATALSPGLYVCRKQFSELTIQVAFLLVTAFAAIISYVYAFDVEQFLWAMSISRSLVLVGLVFMVFYYSRGYGAKAQKHFVIKGEEAYVDNEKN